MFKKNLTEDRPTSRISPPKFCLVVLKWVLKKDYYEEISGDMEEVFQDNLEKHSELRSKWFFIVEAILITRLSLLKNFSWILKLTFVDMLVNNFKIAFRTISKFKSYSAINLVGLAIGLTVGGFILLFVSDELSFDTFHEKKDRLYKVISRSEEGGLETNGWPIGRKLATEYPEVEQVVYSRVAPSSFKLNFEGKKLDHNIHYASEDFFKMFSFKMIEGNPETALDGPYQAVITESMSNSYFQGDPVGKVLTLRDSLNFQVTGVIQDVPVNSHIAFDVLLSFKTFEALTEWFNYSEGWANFNVRNYVLLKEGADIENLRATSSSLYTENVGDWMDEMGVSFLVDYIPMEDVYLKSDFGNGLGPTGFQSKVQTVMLIAIFVLFLACINYTNLTTARSIYRAKEVGLRKVSGSTQISLVFQFLTESFVLTLISFFIAVVIIFVTLPFFNELIGKTYTLESFLTFDFILGSIALILIISLTSGIYPATFIAGSNPLTALSGKIDGNQKGVSLRKLLIVFQFFVTASIVVATLLVSDQIHFMRTQNLGFDGEQILIVDGTNLPRSSARNSFKNELAALPGVQQVSFANALPGRPGWQGQWAYPEKVSDNHVDTEYMAIDENYVETLGLELLAGRNFETNRPSEMEGGLIINETCVKEMGWASAEDAIGKQIVSPSGRPEGTVIGVVKDYHGQGLHSEIWPKAMDYDSETYGRYYALRFETPNTFQLVEEMTAKWEEVFSSYQLDYFFLDEDFERQYRDENQLANVLSTFTVLILIISAIGLLGLISFIALSKTKEVGIRKTLGASIFQIVSLLSKEFILLVFIGNLIAIPLVWIYGNEWLDNFAYHTDLNPFIFLVTIIVTLILAFLTISLQTIKTAKMNPVKALRYE